MADAAVWMAVAAFLTFIVTSFGTLLIWRQVRLTREAVEDTGKATGAMLQANTIAANAQRPWIAISAELLDFSQTERRNFTLSYCVTFENTGHMVAENFHALVKFVPMGEPFLAHQKEWFDQFERDTQVRDTVVIPGQIYSSTFQSNGAIEWLPWCEQAGFRKDCYLMVLAMARYRIPGETQWRFAMKAFSIGENISHIDNRHVIYDSLELLTAEQLVIQPMGRSRAT